MAFGVDGVRNRTAAVDHGAWTDLGDGSSATARGYAVTGLDRFSMIVETVKSAPGFRAFNATRKPIPLFPIR